MKCVAILLAIAACSAEPMAEEFAGDRCTVAATANGREVTATARYYCDVAEVTASLRAYLEIGDARFWFGMHGQIVSCGSSLTEHYRLPNGTTSEVMVIVADFREGQVNCEAVLP